MIQIFISDRAYENDVRPIVKAFYPEEEIVVSDTSDSQEECNEKHKTKNCCIRIDFYRDGVKLSIIDKAGRNYDSYTDTPDPINEKASYKNAMKRQLYNMLFTIS